QSADYAATVRAIVDLVVQAQKEIGGVATVGIATPGAISGTTGLIKNSNSTVLNGRPLLGDIATALGQPVRIENDANCLAISEAADGAAAGANVVFGAILGTGVGGGLVVGLASIINVVDPDVVVLGGGLSNIHELYYGLAALIAAFAFSNDINTKIVKAMHGDSSGVRGAAWLWPPKKDAQTGD